MSPQAVLAHEAGHVVAGHTAQAQGQVGTALYNATEAQANVAGAQLARDAGLDAEAKVLSELAYELIEGLLR